MPCRCATRLRHGPMYSRSPEEPSQEYTNATARPATRARGDTFAPTSRRAAQRSRSSPQPGYSANTGQSRACSSAVATRPRTRREPTRVDGHVRARGGWRATTGRPTPPRSSRASRSCRGPATSTASPGVRRHFAPPIARSRGCPRARDGWGLEGTPAALRSAGATGAARQISTMIGRGLGAAGSLRLRWSAAPHPADLPTVGARQEQAAGMSKLDRDRIGRPRSRRPTAKACPPSGMRRIAQELNARPDVAVPPLRDALARPRPRDDRGRRRRHPAGRRGRYPGAEGALGDPRRAFERCSGIRGRRRRSWIRSSRGRRPAHLDRILGIMRARPPPLDRAPATAELHVLGSRILRVQPGPVRRLARHPPDPRHPAQRRGAAASGRQPAALAGARRHGRPRRRARRGATTTRRVRVLTGPHARRGLERQRLALYP